MPANRAWSTKTGIAAKERRERKKESNRAAKKHKRRKKDGREKVGVRLQNGKAAT